ncbi:dihydrofolate reductase family protein [Actinomycetospora endophytica]|uniref:Dihydrofolate reductase family protein n=1 Tax=Actinomycetospora endophytica TaxID=2291215 RepID=A0ABS8PET6_9PSEU|nr:dihydrofolate reductase family protein [Actinomycetospora endophytica]MCD2196767.1 dihydrofolate reductase family protein [Actinomycetospora endophytica]
MGTVVVKQWMSLDGVVESESMATWFAPFHSDARGARITADLAEADAMVMGRRTYETLAPYWSVLQNNEMGVADRINGMKKYVASHSMTNPTWINAEVLPGDAVTAVATLKNESDDLLYVDGSAHLAGQLLAAGLVDELRLLINPVVMGRGVNFYDAVPPGTVLEPVAITPLDLGVVAARYAVRQG